MQQPISITAIHSISPLGNSLEDSWANYQKNSHCFSEKYTVLVGKLPQHAKDDINELRDSDIKYKSLDDTVLFAIYSAREAIKQAGWKGKDNFGINIGSSRGATQLLEAYYEDFLSVDKTEALSSPTTTLGNISSWVAHDLQTQGPEISHSITCSTGLHAILNGIAWLQSGMSERFLVGGSEAPLTPFTIAQMQALKVYGKNKTKKYPCKPLDINKTQNTMILAEAASMACLELGVKPNALATIIGIGYATEILEHNASLSTDAICFQRSMKMALGNLNPNNVDVIVTHSPGTVKGDLSELHAIQSIFKDNMPLLTTNKWKIGHSLGPSGMLSIEMAILMLKHQAFISVPYLEYTAPKQITTIMVNAVGFGSNAVSILLQKT